MTNFRRVSALAGENRYADLQNINHTAKVSVVASPKTAGNVSLTNTRNEYVETNKLSVTNGTDNGLENVSFRCVLSGSTNNKVALREMAVRGFANFLAAWDDGGNSGVTNEVSLSADSTV